MLEGWRSRGEMSRIPIVAGIDGAVGGFATKSVLSMVGQMKRCCKAGARECMGRYCRVS
jgi:hypothetical protein